MSFTFQGPSFLFIVRVYAFLDDMESVKTGYDVFLVTETRRPQIDYQHSGNDVNVDPECYLGPSPSHNPVYHHAGINADGR